MSFCTVVNCMDGRTQLPVIHYLKKRYGVMYVDLVTEPGPVGLLSKPGDTAVKESIARRVTVSRDAHGSTLVALVAHTDCAGNPVSEEVQHKQLEVSVAYLAKTFPMMSIIGLWIDASWSVSEACSAGPSDKTGRP